MSKNKIGIRRFRLTPTQVILFLIWPRRGAYIGYPTDLEELHDIASLVRRGLAYKSREIGWLLTESGKNVRYNLLQQIEQRAYGFRSRL